MSYEGAVLGLIMHAMDLPSADQAASEMMRPKNRSSTGIGLAFGFCAAVTELGSVIWRSDGPETANIVPTNSMHTRFFTASSCNGSMTKERQKARRSCRT